MFGELVPGTGGVLRRRLFGAGLSGGLHFNCRFWALLACVHGWPFDLGNQRHDWLSAWRDWDVIWSWESCSVGADVVRGGVWMQQGSIASMMDGVCVVLLAALLHAPVESSFALGSRMDLSAFAKVIVPAKSGAVHVGHFGSCQGWRRVTLAFGGFALLFSFAFCGLLGAAFGFSLPAFGFS